MTILRWPSLRHLRRGRIRAPLALLLVPLVLGGCSIRCTVHECCPADPLNQIGIDIPDNIHGAVLKVLPGFVASEFEVESKDGELIYEFEGESEGKHYEVLVDGDGNVLRIDEEIEDETSEDGDS